MKVLLLSSRSDFGGGPEHLRNLLKGLEGRVEFYVASPLSAPYYQIFIEFVGVDKHISIPHRKFSFSALYSLLKFVRRNDIDIVHSHGKGAGSYSRILAFISGRVCVHTYHGFHVREYGPVKKVLYVVYERLSSLFTSRVIAVSQGEAKEIVKSRASQSDRVVTVPNAVTPSVNLQFRDVGVVHSPVRLLHVTRFNTQKNFPLLLESASKLKREGFEFVIDVFGPISDSDKREYNQKQLVNMGIADNVVIKGAKFNLREDYFSKYDLFVTTSLWEGLPIAVLEAMSEGLVVVCTNVTGHQEVIEHGINGYIYDLDAFSDGLVKSVLETQNGAVSGSLRVIQSNAIDSVSRDYSFSQFTKKYFELYRSVLAV